MITLLIAFLGKAMAYHSIASYDGTSELHVKIQQQTFINDNGNSIASEKVDDCCEVECCENECICPVNTCASFVYLDNNLLSSDGVFLSESALSSEITGTHFIAASLYRPPILPLISFTHIPKTT